MATIPDDTLTEEDLVEDLEFHQVLLKSLIEERPDDIEGKQDLEATVMDLERKLAQRRAVPYQPPFVQGFESPRGVSGFNGTDSESSASASARLSVSDPDVFLQPQQHASSRLKRPVELSDIASPFRSPSSKRVRSERLASSPSSAASSQLPFSYNGSVDHGSDPFSDDFFDLDDGGLEGLQEGQYEAEKWLEKRREQERKDEEFARLLQTRWDEELSHVSQPSQTPQAQSNKSHTITEKITTTMNYRPMKESPSSTPQYPPAMYIPSLDTPSMRHPSMAPSPFAANSSQAPSPFAAYPRNPAFTQPRLPSEGDFYDSSDSDLAEISGNDFYQHHTSTAPRIHSAPYPGYMPGGYPPPHPSALRYPSELLSNGHHALGGSHGAVYGTMPGRTKIGIEGIGYPASPYDDEPIDRQQSNEGLKELLENIRPDIEIFSKHGSEGTPKELNFDLYEHQKIGLAWMKEMEEGNNKGGILADDMGLGKTVQALSLIVSRPSTDPARKTTLIIAPVALLQQWKREIDRLLKPEHKLDVFILHGERRKTNFEKLKKYDVVLTTTGTMSSELKMRDEWEEQRRFAEQNSANMLEKARSLSVLGPESAWYRVIIDEAQYIKNRNTKSAIACCALNTTYRWCMTGTPMMNNVGELHSLIKFLRIRPYNSLERFNMDFTRPLKTGSKDLHQKAFTQLRVLLKAVLLRRTKTSKLADGRPIINLPPRVTEKVHAVFSDDEQELYKALEGRTQLQFNRYLKAGTVGKNYSQVLVLLLRLRQACCHPHLINDLSVDISAVTETADFVENAKAFSPDVVRRLKENEPLECPVCIDAVENPVIFFPCGHATCTECFARISDPALAVQQGVEGQAETKCPNCRAKIDPKKVTDHLSFKKVHFPDQVSDDQQVERPPDSDDDDDGSDSDDESEDDSDSDLADFIVPDDYDSDVKTRKKRNTKGRRKSGKSGKGKGKDKDKEFKKPKKTLAVLRKEGQRNAASKRKYFKRLEKNWQPSAKIEKAVEILENTKNSGSGEKTIIFSQFTSLLDLLEVPIHRRGWKYRRFDGSMRPKDRNDAVLEFTDDPECQIMLVSLKAGNAGLNLVAASQVIIFDPFWNPYIEEQAIDRAHRLGQTRPVQVHRILVEKTVEDRILALQEEKRELIDGALDENAAKQVSRLGVRELKLLFNVQ